MKSRFNIVFLFALFFCSMSPAVEIDFSVIPDIYSKSSLRVLPTNDVQRKEFPKDNVIKFYPKSYMGSINKELNLRQGFQTDLRWNGKELEARVVFISNKGFPEKIFVSFESGEKIELQCSKKDYWKEEDEYSFFSVFPPDEYVKYFIKDIPHTLHIKWKDFLPGTVLEYPLPSETKKGFQDMKVFFNVTK